VMAPRSKWSAPYDVLAPSCPRTRRRAMKSKPVGAPQPASVRPAARPSYGPVKQLSSISPFPPQIECGCHGYSIHGPFSIHHKNAFHLDRGVAKQTDGADGAAGSDAGLIAE